MTSPWELRQSRDHVAFRGPAGLGGASRRGMFPVIEASLF